MASSDDVAQFVAITGADADAAKFYLDSAGGNTEAALSAYFESDGAAGAALDGDQAQDETLDDPDFTAGELHAPTA
jgi:UBA-like domain